MPSTINTGRWPFDEDIGMPEQPSSGDVLMLILMLESVDVGSDGLSGFAGVLGVLLSMHLLLETILSSVHDETAHVPLIQLPPAQYWIVAAHVLPCEPQFSTESSSQELSYS